MDAAALSLNIDSSKVVQAANDLDRFSASSDRAAASAGKVNFGSQSGSIAKMVALVQSIDTKMSALIGTLTKAQQAEKALSAANDNTASSMAKAGAAVAVADSHVIAYTQHLAGLARAQQDANAHVVAWQNRVQAVSPALAQADAHVVAYRNSLGKVAEGANAASTAIKFTALDTLNASRQLADVGVTLAMGMNPLMVAIQQGPQLLDILQNKAAMTGQTLGTVFKAAASSIGAALLPLLPLIAILGVAAAAIAALNAQANDDSGLKKYTTAMGYTKAEVEKLNAVTVTYGDTMKAVFQVGFERIAAAFGISSADIASAWKSVMSFLITLTRETVAGIYASFTGVGYAVKRVIDNIKAGKVENPFTTLLEGAKSARKDALGFMDDVVKQSQKNARARQDAMAKAMYDKPNTPKGGKSDAEKLADIIRNAEAEIKAEQARGAAVGLSARAATELEQRTKLLNQIEKAKIPVTAAVTKEVERLAGAYARAKVAAETAAAVQSVIDNSDMQKAALNDQNNLIGIYGDELTRARIQMEMLTEAQNKLPKGETLSTGDANRISNEARDRANNQILFDRNQRIERARKDNSDAMYALELERNGLALTGAAAESYAYIVERLNQAKREGQPLSAQELADLKRYADAYGQTRYAIDRMREIEGVKYRGLDSLNSGIVDAITGVKSLGSAFKDVANQIIADLLRIAVQRSITEPLANSLFGGGSRSNIFSSILGAVGIGSSNTLGGVSASSQAALNSQAAALAVPRAFAKGGVFTNQIVNTPTLFRFANGAQFGEMGEAGPEAIMPLKRGANGALGVQMHGGGKPSMRLGDNHFTIKVEGGFMPDAVIAVARQAGEEAVNTARRSFQDWAAEWDQGGTMVS